jgi:iron complex transport system permease protein
VLFAAALVTLFLAVGMGPVWVSPWPQGWTTLERNIVVGLRLPRVLLGFIVGASLSVTGVAMQALVRNQLADPFILGVSSGAAATATLGMLFGAFSFLGTYSLSISAFIGAAFTITLVYLI